MQLEAAGKGAQVLEDGEVLSPGEGVVDGGSGGGKVAGGSAHGGTGEDG